MLATIVSEHSSVLDSDYLQMEVISEIRQGSSHHLLMCPGSFAVIVRDEEKGE